MIPKITDPLGKYWEQPSSENILIDDTHAIKKKSWCSEYKVGESVEIWHVDAWKPSFVMDIKDGVITCRHPDDTLQPFWVPLKIHIRKVKK